MPSERVLEVQNPAAALRNQSGKFKVVSPNGYTFEVTCRRGRKLRIREIGALEPILSAQLTTWQIEKIV